MDVDRYLSELGSFGRYHNVLMVLFAIIACWFPALQVFSFIFILYEPPHHCKTRHDYNISLPIGEDGEYEQCVRFVYDNTSMKFLNETETCKDGWEYDVEEGQRTLVTELNLVCDQKILSTVAVSVYFCGILVGALISGQLSDTIGRKKTGFLTIIIGAFAGTVLVFTKTYIAFVVVWFILAMCEMSILTTLFILYAELCAPKERMIILAINAVSFGVGFCLITPIAYIFKDWRHFQLAITLPIIVFLPCWWVIVESPRWLLSKGRFAEAKEVFKKIAKFNNKYDLFLSWNIPDNHGNELLEDLTKEKLEKNTTADPTTYTILDTLKTPQIRKYTIVLFYLWAVNSMVYYGLALNSSSVVGNLYMNTFLLGLAEVPSYLFIIFATTRYGRRKLALLFHILAAASLFLIIVVPTETGSGKDLSVVTMTFAFIGKFSITTSYTVIWHFTSELFPTVIRNIGFNACSMAARIGGIAAPYVMYLGNFVDWIPIALCTILSLSAGFMALLLPETLNRSLPETIEDAENIRNIDVGASGYQKAKTEDKNSDDFVVTNYLISKLLKKSRTSLIMEIDEYFEKLGEFGRYNFVLITLVSVIGSGIPAMHILSSVFIFYAPPHHCQTDRELNVSIPLSDDGELEKCVMFPNDTKGYLNASTIPCQEGWTYEGKAVTLVTEVRFIVQSPRWLMSKSRWPEAKAAFIKIAEFNKIPAEELTWIENIKEAHETHNKKDDSNPAKLYTILDIMKTPKLRKTSILMFYLWFVNSVIYYGLSITSSTISGDRFINFLLLAVAEILAMFIAIYALQRYGRRHLLFIFHTIVSIACIIVAFVPGKTDGGVNLSPLTTTSAFIGKLSISITFMIMWIFASEIYPTVIRTTCVNTCSMFARFGGMAAPYLMHLGKILPWLPMFSYGALSIVAGVVALLLTETINQPLPQTIEDVEGEL
ncbi:organic cation transporter protein-like [Antedon mediterranea]|uniref:organic cation transporter protein-like n=1 Tax=Antedon mediterranea TaxID=105859 RepID=UPI003AF6D1DE